MADYLRLVFGPLIGLSLIFVMAWLVSRARAMAAEAADDVLDDGAIPRSRSAVASAVSPPSRRRQ